MPAGRGRVLFHQRHVPVPGPSVLSHHQSVFTEFYRVLPSFTELFYHYEILLLAY